MRRCSVVSIACVWWALGAADGVRTGLVPGWEGEPAAPCGAVVLAAAQSETQPAPQDEPASQAVPPEGLRPQGRLGQGARQGFPERGPRRPPGPRSAGPGPGPEGFEPGGPPQDFIGPEETEEMMAFAKQYFPELYEALERARKSDPIAFRRILHRSRGMIARFLEADPPLREALIAEHKATVALQKLQRDYQFASSSDKRDHLKAQMRAELENRFKCRQERLKLEIAQLRQRLEEQARRLEEQQSNQAQLIEREFNEMIARLEEERPH